MPVMRRGVLILSICALASFGLVPPGLHARQGDPVPEVSPVPQVSAEFLTFFLWKNDRDFDSTEPLFDEYGQSSGYVDLTLYPRIVWRPHASVLFTYFAEVGNAFWSRTDPDRFSEALQNKPVYIQKELWVDVLLPWEGYGIRAGLLYMLDPTYLFLEKYVGALQASRRTGTTSLRFSALQVPDTAYEGFTFDENNFQNDHFVFGLDGAFRSDRALVVRPGAYLQWDRSDVDREKLMFNGSLNLAWKPAPGVAWDLDAVLQAGTWRNRSIGNRDLDILAGAVQLHGALERKWGGVEINLLAFSPDGPDPHDGLDSAFTYSGFSRSRTLVLSQNWIFDQYNNLDESVAAAGAGMFLADVFGRVALGGGVELFAVAGYGMVLEPRYAGGGRTVGTEVDAGALWNIHDRVRLIGLGGALLPGHAGAALTNEIDLAATDPMYYFQGAVEVAF